MTSNPCPNHIWNHTGGCVCVANGSITAEAADIDLTSAPTTITSEMIAEALGDGPDLSDDEKRVLGILLDPRNHLDTGRAIEAEWMLEEVTGIGDGTDNYSARQIGELLDAHYAREAHAADPDDYRAGTFSMTMPEDSDSYTVDVYLGTKMGGDYLSSHHDIKYLSPDRYFTDETTGLRKAIHFARTLDEDFQEIRGKAIRLGLIKDPSGNDREATLRAALRAAHAPSYLTDRQAKVEEIDRFIDTARPFIDRTGPAVRKSPWPETDAEREAFEWWKHEAGNGDTNAAFRDWYENPDRTAHDENDED